LIPATHLLTGYLAGRAVRLTSDAPAPKRGWLDPIVIMAVGAAVVPDLDVVPGVLGFPVSDWHRGATHSLVGIPLQALLLTIGARFAWKLVFGEVLSWRPLYRSALVGLVSHVLWDYLNPWGVGLLWPLSEDKHLANLVHEGDVFVLSALIAGSILVATRCYRSGFATPLVCVAVYILFQFQWSSTIKQQAVEELSSDFIHVYPNAQIDCLWLVLTRFQGSVKDPHIEAHCVSAPLSGERRLTLEKPLIDDPMISESAKLFEVKEFQRQRYFPFAEIHRQPDGSATVIWRDLREAVFETQSEQPSGYYLHFSPDGRLIDYEHKWFLRLWFW